MKNLNRDFLLQLAKKSGIRALWTFLEAIGGMITAGQAFFDINWKNVLGVALTAAVLSFIKSMVTGLPEVD